MSQRRGREGFIASSRRRVAMLAVVAGSLWSGAAGAQIVGGVVSHRPTDQQATEIVRMNQLGARWVRVKFIQSDLSNPGPMRDYLDRLKAAQKNVLAVLNHEVGGLDPHDPNTDVMRAAVQSVVDQFDSDANRIDAYEIWNEPDVPAFQINSDQFINLLNTVWTATTAPSHGTIVTGGQWTVERYDGDVSAIFISQMRNSFDRAGLPSYPFHVIGVHSYGFDDGSTRTNIPYHVGLTFQLFPGAPVWCTEFGYGTESPGHSEAGQADFINRVVNDYRSIPPVGTSTIEAVFYYSLINTNEGGEASTMGICREDPPRSPKLPGFSALADQFGGPGIPVIDREIICRDVQNCEATEMTERPLQISRTGGNFYSGVRAIIVPPRSCTFRLDEFLGYGCSGPSQSSTSGPYSEGGIIVPFTVDPSPYAPGQYSGRLVANCDGSASPCINVNLSE